MIRSEHVNQDLRDVQAVLKDAKLAPVERAVVTGVKLIVKLLLSLRSNQVKIAKAQGIELKSEDRRPREGETTQERPAPSDEK